MPVWAATETSAALANSRSYGQRSCQPHVVNLHKNAGHTNPPPRRAFLISQSPAPSAGVFGPKNPEVRRRSENSGLGKAAPLCHFLLPAPPHQKKQNHNNEDFPHPTPPILPSPPFPGSPTERGLSGLDGFAGCGAEFTPTGVVPMGPSGRTGPGPGAIGGGPGGTMPMGPMGPMGPMAPMGLGPMGPMLMPMGSGLGKSASNEIWGGSGGEWLPLGFEDNKSVVSLWPTPKTEPIQACSKGSLEFFQVVAMGGKLAARPSSRACSGLGFGGTQVLFYVHEGHMLPHKRILVVKFACIIPLLCKHRAAKPHIFDRL